MGNQYSYFDYPDGENCFYKTACVTKKTSVLAFFVASLDVVNYSKPNTIGGALTRYPRYMVPGVMTGVAFGMTACTLTMLRQKDDNWNYFFAGGAAGTVIGIARRSFKVGTPCTVALAIAGVAFKEWVTSDYSKIKRYPNVNGQWDSMDADYTLTPERPKYTVDRPSFI